MNERQLVIRAQQGDTAAFEALVDHYARYAYNVALRLVRNPEEAEDLAQEAFLRAWRSIKDFRQEAKFSTWLYRIVTNLCYNRLPQLRRELLLIEPEDAAFDLPDQQQAVEAALLSAEQLSAIHAAVDRLPDTYRLLIALRHLQGMSYNEIADVTDLPLGTVKTGIYRGRRLLKSALESSDILSKAIDEKN